MNYEEMLKAGREKMPKDVLESSRFEVPKVTGHIQGNKTVISNFHQIASFLRRDADQIVKFVLRELAAPGNLTKTGLILGTKIPASRVNEKIQKYVDDFVLCPACRKPDTKLLREDKILFKKCEACGAKNIVKTKI